MADVLSIVSGVISVVTAVKDLVALALEARNTFIKNKRSAQDLEKLSKEVITILEGIKKHAETTGPDLDTGDADEMDSLLTTFATDIEDLSLRIGRLAQSPSLVSKIFRRRETEVEEAIADIRKCLKERVKLFTLFSNICSRRVAKNTERAVQMINQEITALTVTTANIYQTTTTIATSVRGGSWSVAQVGASQMGPPIHPFSHLNGTGVNTVAWIQASEDLQIQLRRYLSRFPKASSMLSMSIIAELYLGCQVDVALSLCERLRGKHFAELWVASYPEDEEAFPIRSRESMQRIALGHLLALQQIMGQDFREYTTKEANDACNCIVKLRRTALCLGLWDVSDALLVASTDIRRKIFDMKAPASVSIFLNNLLVSAASTSTTSSERVSVLEEVQKLIQSADKATPNLDLLKAWYLALCLKHSGIDQSEEIIPELLLVLDNLGVDILRGNTTFASSQRNLYISTRLASALCDLGDFYMKTQRYQEAANAYTCSLSIYERNVEDWMTESTSKADVHFKLTHENLRSVLSAEDTVRHAKAAVDLTRPSYLADPQTWACTQHDYLYRYGLILWGRELYEVALLVWKEAEEIVEQHLADEFLASLTYSIANNLSNSRRYAESAGFYRRYLTLEAKSCNVDVLANVHSNLAEALYQSGRVADAIPEAVLAVEHIHRVALCPNTSDDAALGRLDLARAYARLALCQHKAGENEQAIPNAQMAKKYLETLTTSHPRTYLRAAEACLGAATELCQPAPDAEDFLRQLTLSSKSQTTIGLLYVNYIACLRKSDRLDEGLQASRMSLQFFQAHISEEDAPLCYTVVVRQHGILLREKGFIGAILTLLDTATVVLQTLNIPFGPEFVWNWYFDIFRSRLSRRLGRYNDSLRYAKGVLESIGAVEDLNGRWSRAEPESKTLDDLFLHALFEHQRALEGIGDWDAGLAAARNVIEVWFRNDNFSKKVSNSPDDSLFLLANSLSDAGIDTEALDYAQKASQWASENSSTVRKWLHPIQTYNFFDIEPDNSDIAEALNSDAKYVEKRPGFAPDFAVVLWSIGIFYCHHRMHEEGLSAAEELRNLRKKYDGILFDVVEAIGVALKFERSRPSWKRILDKIRLECGHQDI